MKKFLLVLAGILLSSNVQAWEGYDANGHYIEVEAESFEEGDDIDIYDHDSSTYRQVRIDRMYDQGNYVEIEAYDYNSDTYVTFDFEEF